MESAGSRTIAWRAPSLRGRVTFLAGTVVVLLTLTLLILVLVLSSSQANLVAQSNKHLEAVVRSLADAYETRSDRDVSLTANEFLPAPPPPPAPPGMNPKPSAPAGEGPLANLTSRVLQDETGIEGGYFRPGNPSLAGYAFPTHEGPGDVKVLPARETPTILHVAAAAMRSGKIQHDQFYGAHDVVLFMAAPVCETSSCTGGPVGAAWLMQRLPGAESDRKRAVLWSAFGFGTVACVTMILAFVVLRQVDGGTRAVLNRLGRMESDLSEDDPRAPVGLAEFHRVLDGLDRLGATLRSQFEKERELERKVRQHERLAAIGQLAAGVAHDLRNPLATIRLRAQMAQRKTIDEPVFQAAGVILTEVDRLDAIIERLLDFSRPIRLSPVETDVAQMCYVAASRWRARNDVITYVCEGENHVVTVTDPGRLQQVLDNVIENSVQQLVETKTASPVITMECGQDTGEVWLEIRDNAGGFTKEALKNAAEPFFTTRAKGTGLGLAIGNDIMQALGGSIQLSNRNVGAVVRLALRRIAENEV